MTLECIPDAYHLMRTIALALSYVILRSLPPQPLPPTPPCPDLDPRIPPRIAELELSANEAINIKHSNTFEVVEQAMISLTLLVPLAIFGTYLRCVQSRLEQVAIRCHRRLSRNTNSHAHVNGAQQPIDGLVEMRIPRE